MTLTLDTALPHKERFDLGGGASLVLISDFLPRTSADELFRILVENVAWQQGSVRFFGREVREPRLTLWFSEAEYSYSGRTLPPRAWPPELLPVRTRVELAAGAALNSVLLNRYRNGDDSMGLHSDDEPELGPNPVVASLSLGETRRFVLKPKRERDGCAELKLDLEHGSLLVMGGTCQHTHRHAVPKQRHVRGERINLTFRNVAPKAETRTGSSQD